MSTVAIKLEPEWVDVLRPLSDRPLNALVKELTILELYRRRQVSSGKAAELLGMERFEFIRYTSREGIAFLDLSEGELAAEMDRVRAIA